jgi:hypothetical protein
LCFDGHGEGGHGEGGIEGEREKGKKREKKKKEDVEDKQTNGSVTVFFGWSHASVRLFM